MESKHIGPKIMETKREAVPDHGGAHLTATRVDACVPTSRVEEKKRPYPVETGDAARPLISLPGLPEPPSLASRSRSRLLRMCRATNYHVNELEQLEWIREYLMVKFVSG